MASIFSLNARTAAQPTPPERPTPAPSELANRGRQALLAHDYDGAEEAFAALSRDADPAHAHDGRVGLAMLTLSTLAPQTAPTPEAPTYTPALRRAPSSVASWNSDDAEMVDAPSWPSSSGASTPRSTAGSAVPASPAAPADDARFDDAVATLKLRPFAAQSELSRLGAARAALHLGRPDDAWRALAGAPDSPEALLGRAASQFGLGAPQRARDILWPAVRPFAGGPRLGASGTAGGPGTHANLPAATRAALQAAYIAVDAAVGDNDLRYSAKDLGTHVRRYAPDSYAAAALDVVEAPGEAKEAAWHALRDRWPRSAEAAMLGVRFGFVTADGRGALLRERPRDALLRRAALVGALGAENWADAVEATEALWSARPTPELAGLAVRLGSLAKQSAAWMRERVARTMQLSDAQPQAVLRQAHTRIAAGGVDETLVDKMRRLAVGGQPEAMVSLAQALKLQGRHDEALATLDVFLQPTNATSALFGTALLMRAKHRLYEQGRVMLDHDAACAEVSLAHSDLQRIGPQDAAYEEAVQLQPLLSDRLAQVSAGVRYRLNEQQVRHEIEHKQFDRVRANLDYHGQSAENQESDLFWLLRACTYEAMGPGNYAKARHAAEVAVDVALMRRRKNTAAEEILRRLYDLDEGVLHRVLSFANGLFNWLSGLLGAGTK